MKMIIDYLKKEKNIPEEEIFYFTFEDPLNLEEFDQDPQEFVRARLKQPDRRTYFFFDEFHYSQEGGRKLKLLYDLFPKIKIFISGSSSLELTFQTAKHLVDRIFYFYLFPLSFEEFLEFRQPDIFNSYQEKRELMVKFIQEEEGGRIKPSIFEKRLALARSEFVRFGGYPEVVVSKDETIKIRVLQNIVSTYLQRDIRSLLLIEDLASYQNLLRLLAAQTGDLANFAQLGNDAGLSFPLLRKYLKILEETFVIKKVSPYFKNLSSEIRKTPKFYFLNLGLRHALLNDFSKIDNRADKGKVAENLVFSQLYKRYYGQPVDLNFWRTRGKAEVDFILRTNKLTPIEVKFRKFPKPTLGKGYLSFLTSCQPKRGLMITKEDWYELKVGHPVILFHPIWYA